MGVRPTQGRTLAVAEVSGGSQSFNAVNSLRILGRWMRMFVIPNQSSVPQAYTQFTSEDDEVEGGSRMKPSGNRDRIVDCMEEFVKYTIVMRPHFGLFSDRYSEGRRGLGRRRWRGRGRRRRRRSWLWSRMFRCRGRTHLECTSLFSFLGAVRGRPRCF